MNPYATFVQEFARLIREGKDCPLGVTPSAHPPQPAPPADAPRVLIFSPHPDDEVIIGGIALRLRRELNWNVLNVAVTLGSNKARQAPRWRELQACCGSVGFGLLATAESGLEGINLRHRTQEPQDWARSVDAIQRLLQEQQPRVILFPHDDDWNSTHIGTHHLLMDALRRLGAGFRVWVVETEFWGAMKTPNLMVQLSDQDVTDLITALSFHVGEVQRNPYHLRLPAWLMDNVRRGGELVGGQGGAAPDYLFGTLYRVRHWSDGQLQPAWKGGRFVGAEQDLGALFPVVGR